MVYLQATLRQEGLVGKHRPPAATADTSRHSPVASWQHDHHTTHDLVTSHDSSGVAADSNQKLMQQVDDVTSDPATGDRTTRDDHSFESQGRLGLSEGQQLVATATKDTFVEDTVTTPQREGKCK